ncbi:MAG: helix-turn-helix transcriptional regulator [Clostridiales bacterium]|jgi:AraC-like DNA-binding protein|nr:helix-turn-helix transcriptional regulator [Clostridiales bacterium]
MNLSHCIKPNTLIDTNYRLDFSMPEMHAHHTVELNYMREGLLDYEYTDANGNTVTVPLAAGQFIVFKPYVPHHILKIHMPSRLCILELYISQKSPDFISFLLTLDYVRRLPTTVNLLNSFNDAFIMTDNRKVEKVLSDLLILLHDKTHNRADEFFEANYELLLKSLLIEISQCKKNEIWKPGNKHIQNAVAFMRANYNRNIAFRTIAEHVGVSPAYLQKIFKQTYGETVMGVLTRYRLEKAHSLLTHTNIPVSMVANRIGYRKLHSFSSIFKKYYSQSPLDFRNAQKTKTFNYSLYYGTETIHDDESYPRA